MFPRQTSMPQHKYFGTDGVRGVANAELTPELAFKLGRYGGYVLLQQAEGNAHPRVLVGRDTRISGQLLEHALIAGLLSLRLPRFSRPTSRRLLMRVKVPAPLPVPPAPTALTVPSPSGLQSWPRSPLRSPRSLRRPHQRPGSGT